MLRKAVHALSLRQRLLSGGTAYGPIVLSDSPTVAELLATIGYDFLILDQEHSPANPSTTQHMMRAIDSMQRYRPEDSPETSIIVRLPSADTDVKQTLDSLPLASSAGGILVPMVEDAETAERVVEKTRFPGAGGTRGCAAPFVRATGYGTIDYTQYEKQCAEDILVMVQVETPDGLESIPDIAAVDGVDGIFLGPLDISASIGKMGQFDSPEFQNLIERAESLIRRSDSCFLAGFRVPGRTAKDMFDRDYSLVCSAVDLGLLKAAALSDCSEGKKAMANK